MAELADLPRPLRKRLYQPLSNVAIDAARSELFHTEPPPVERVAPGLRRIGLAGQAQRRPASRTAAAKGGPLKPACFTP